MNANLDQDIVDIANTVLAQALMNDDVTIEQLNHGRLADDRLFNAVWDVALATEQTERYTAEGDELAAEFAREQLALGSRELRHASWNYQWTYKMLPHQQAA